MFILNDSFENWIDDYWYLSSLILWPYIVNISVEWNKILHYLPKEISFSPLHTCRPVTIHPALINQVVRSWTPTFLCHRINALPVSFQDACYRLNIFTIHISLPCFHLTLTFSKWMHLTWLLFSKVMANIFPTLMVIQRWQQS